MRFDAASVLPLVLLGCSGLPSSSSLSVTITPMTASVKEGSTINLSVAGSGFTHTPVAQWSMLEPNPTAGRNCGFVTIQDASFANCPAGYVVYPPTLQ